MRGVRDRARTLLTAGVAVPFLYFGNLLFSALFYPDYSHIRQYASELGSAAAPHPWIFNTGVSVTALAVVAAAVGFHFALRRLGARPLLTALFVLALALFGVGAVFGALFPMPDPRHGGYGLGMAINVAPLLLALALWKRRDLRALNVFLLVNCVVVTILFAIMMGAGQLVTRANVGAFQRAYALAGFPWIGIAAWVLRRRLPPPVS